MTRFWRDGRRHDRALPVGMTMRALLMRLGVTTLRGSNPRSSADDQGCYDDCLAYLRRFRGSALVSPHIARTRGPGPVVGYLVDGKLWHPSDVTIVRRDA